MSDAHSNIGEDIQVTRTDLLEGAHNTAARPVNTTQVGRRGGVSECRVLHDGEVEDVEGVVPQEPDAQRIGFDRDYRDAEKVGVLNAVGGRLDAAVEATATAEFGVGSWEGIDIGGIADGKAVEGVIDQHRGSAPVAGTLVIELEVGGGSVGGGTASNRNPGRLIGDVAPCGVGAVYVQQAARWDMAKGAVKNADAVGEVVAGYLGIVLGTGGFVHEEPGIDRHVLSGLGMQVEAEPVGEKGFVFRFVCVYSPLRGK